MDQLTFLQENKPIKAVMFLQFHLAVILRQGYILLVLGQ